MSQPVRVVQSFGQALPTTNPYITMLGQALEADPNITLHRFSWKTALFGRYDVFHWHWPETKLYGSSPLKSFGKVVLTHAVWLRHRLSRRIAVVSTVHNLDLPDTDAIRTGLLRRIANSATFAITLNDTTVPKRDIPYQLIPHGHYRDWYAPYAHAETVPGRFGMFGQVRRYKGVDALLDAYREAAKDNPDISLRIGGKPTSAELGQSLRTHTKDVPRLTLDLQFLTDADLVTLATESELVVLAYRFMHNSGSALAALSVDRPVLVPRNEVNEHLAEEVGGEWVQLYDGELTAPRLVQALEAVRTIPAHDRPDLSARDWSTASAQHEKAYRAAIAVKRGEHR